MLRIQIARVLVQLGSKASNSNVLRALIRELLFNYSDRAGLVGAIEGLAALNNTYPSTILKLASG